MPDIKLYDYQRERVPEGTWSVCYWTPPTRHSSIAYSTVPWKDAPLICGFYDEKQHLIGVRFIHKNGKWEDV